MPNQPAEEIVARLCRMDRQAMVHELQRFRARFRMDLTEDFLAGLSTERIRHILLAALLHGRSGLAGKTGD
jgi:hypothetical protein